jgi:hypothetical protein
VDRRGGAVDAEQVTPDVRVNCPDGRKFGVARWAEGRTESTPEQIKRALEEALSRFPEVGLVP